MRQAKENRADLKAMPKLKAVDGGAARKTPIGAHPIKTRLFGRADAPQTAQQSIPYREMFRDGVCHVTDRLYTKTVAFDDINYALAQNEDKSAIFESYCDFLNCATRSHTNTIPLPKSLWALRPCSAKNGGLPVI